jgi:hypothetical protein
MSKEFGFRTQLAVGQAGVRIAKALFRKEGYEIEDYENNRELQFRGIDLYIHGFGYVEIKTDTYDTGNMVLELSDRGLPGALDRSCADWYGVVFVKMGKMVLFPRSALAKWLREAYSWLEDKHPKWFHTIRSYQGNSTWEVDIVVVPLSKLLKEVKGREENVVIEWEEDDIEIAGGWK